MRLLPPAFVGLHPACQPPEPPFSPSNTLQQAGSGGVYGAVLGSTSAALSKVITGSPRWKRSNNIAVCTFLYFTLNGLSSDIEYRKTAKAFLEKRNISLPAFKVADRLGHPLDADNVKVGGAIAGVLIAASLRRLWVVDGWQRWVGSIAYGCGAGTLVFGIYDNSRLG
jgi:hypothetical protein